MKKRAIIVLATAIMASGVLIAIGVQGWTSASTPCCSMPSMSDTAGRMPGMSGGGMQGMFPNIEQLKKDLNLTPAQDEKLDAAVKSFLAEDGAAIADVKAKHAAFVKMLASGSPTKAEVSAKVDEITNLQSKIMIDAAEKILEAKKALTPAQRKTLADKAAEAAPMCMTMGLGCCAMGMGGMAQQMTVTPTGPVTDPSCGMSIDVKDAAGTSTYNGKTYYFCSASCKSKFDKNPAQYAK